MPSILRRAIKACRNPEKIVPFLRFWVLRGLAVFFPAIGKVSDNVEGLLSKEELLYLYLTARSRHENSPILDIGSYKGLSACLFSSLGDVTAYESFEGLGEISKPDEGIFEKGQYVASVQEFKTNIAKWGNENRVTLKAGDCVESIGGQIRSGDMKGFSFAFIDVDLYSPIKETLILLDGIFKRGNKICIHDANSSGVRQAVKEYTEVSKHDVRVSLVMPNILQLELA